MADILILGGYGYTGKPLARHLLAWSNAGVVLGGRHIEKARALADQLNAEFTGQRVSAIYVDAADRQSLDSALSSVDLIVVAAPTTHHAENVVHAALDCRVDYLDSQLGSRKLATLFFLGQWRRLVIIPRSDIERHFAWMKRYFGLKYFQCYSWLRVTQFVLLTYCAALSVALAAQRYDRPELIRRRAMVLAQL